MRVILFGATGMVGQGVLRECVLDPDVDRVLSISRSSIGEANSRVTEVLHDDFFDFGPLDDTLRGFDACLFCLGVSSAGMDEAKYSRLTYDLTMAAAQAVLKANPAITFLYISGTGTDSTETGRSMWARVKGKTENALLRLPFGAAYMLRPGYIQPMHGIRSKTKLYRTIYALVSPIYPLLRMVARRYVITTEELGRAMVEIAKNGNPKHILESSDLLNAAVHREMR